MKITKFVASERDMLADLQWRYSTKCPHIQVTVVDLNAERIAAWNDEDLDNILFTNQDWIKLLGKQEEETYSFYGWKSN
jgi:hypothetical protein